MLRSRFHPPHELARELFGFPRPRRLMAAGSCRRYREPALVEHLVEQCFEHRYGDPDTMLDCAETAVAVARQLSPSASAYDALCRALLHLSNSHRRRAEFDLAATAMEQAKNAWASGSQKPALRAEMKRLEGALLHDLRHLDSSALCFHTAAEHYRSLGDSGNCASSLISEGLTLREAGKPQKAIVAFYRALAAIDVAPTTSYGSQPFRASVGASAKPESTSSHTPSAGSAIGSSAPAESPASPSGSIS